MTKIIYMYLSMYKHTRLQYVKAQLVHAVLLGCDAFQLCADHG